ncbi:hypothetical protein KHA90_08045 [Flavobacterium psychroterrae]|uniref:DUF4136 domain-containing protein n=1 Tax=Flavobacterium psychroterrae TaxID=2133767 RepID=A0ABS5P9I6_9FLAO|nr:hypothetical protein [Flavobacterium psychroterrae]MBS7230972.1 hypothetical protein [Flavobacterium psychroterrae]
MKNYLVCTALVLCAACSTDENLNESQSYTNDQSQSNTIQVKAGNNLNPFDRAGIEFYDKLNSYYNSIGYPASNEDFEAQMLFLAQKPTGDRSLNKSVITITPEMIVAILADPEVKLVELIEASSLSVEVKNSLYGFVFDLVNRQQTDYEDVYSFIISYEAAVIADSSLQTDEKDTILKVSAISRYSLYAEARKDRDWETAVTNKKGSLDYSGGEITLAALAVLFESLL